MSNKKTKKYQNGKIKILKVEHQQILIEDYLKNKKKIHLHK